MTAEELHKRLDAFPRVTLGQYPTPLEHLPALSKELQRPIFCKRDDRIAGEFCGNKTRALEYVMADALQRKARKVATFGALQSNHARITAATAIRYGMEPHLFYFEKRPDAREGNVLFNEKIGARLHFIDFGNARKFSIPVSIRLAHSVAWLSIGPHYFIPVGAHCWRGCLGYVRAAIELNQQAKDLKIEDAWVVLAAGTGATLAGLIVGFSLLHSNLKVVGIDIGGLWKNFRKSIADLASSVFSRLGERRKLRSDEIPLIENRYVGPGYALPTPESTAATNQLEISERILLDPVYTSKAFAGMLDLARRNEISGNGPIIFLHTGGVQTERYS